MRILLTACFSLAACGPQIAPNPPPPPERYLTCKALPQKPTPDDLRVLRFDRDTVVSLKVAGKWERITIPKKAKFYLKADVDARDGEIARYIVNVRGAWADCSIQLGRVRDYVEGVE